MRCRVCQPQERGTLLSQLPWRNSPSIALRNAAPVKIFLPRLFAFFLSGCRFVPGIELTVQHGIELLLQALTDFFFVIILAPQMVHGKVEKQVIGDLYGFHSVLLFSATVATIATVVLRYHFHRCNRRSCRAAYSFLAMKVSVIRRPSCRTLFS